MSIFRDSGAPSRIGEKWLKQNDLEVEFQELLKGLHCQIEVVCNGSCGWCEHAVGVLEGIANNEELLGLYVQAHATRSMPRCVNDPYSVSRRQRIAVSESIGHRHTLPGHGANQRLRHNAQSRAFEGAWILTPPSSRLMIGASSSWAAIGIEALESGSSPPVWSGW